MIRSVLRNIFLQNTTYFVLPGEQFLGVTFILPVFRLCEYRVVHTAIQ